jgi:hypothetical protein
MTIGTIGKKGNRLNLLKANFSPFGGSAMRRKRSMSLPFLGIPGTKICLLYLWEAMILLNKKQVKF